MLNDMRIHFLHIYSVLKFCSKLVRLLEESQTDGPVRTCRDVNNLLILHIDVLLRAMREEERIKTEALNLPNRGSVLTE